MNWIAGGLHGFLVGDAPGSVWVMGESPVFSRYGESAVLLLNAIGQRGSRKAIAIWSRFELIDYD